MAYASWSVVFGEQPSAAKWNILGTNDASFNDGTGIANGAATKSNIYCFSAYDSAGTTLTDGSVVQINLGTEEYDYGGNFAASTYTAPVAGVYHFSGRLQINGAIATGVSCTAYIYKNAAVAKSGTTFVPTANNSSPIVSADLLLAANDAITFRGVQDSAGNESTLNSSEATYFSGFLVRQV